MKRMVFLFVMILGFAVSANAANQCGSNDLPVKVDGGWFLSDSSIVAMGGDATKEIGWRGDRNNWKYATASRSQNGGKNGFLFTGTGSDYERWNPYQKGASNGGWLRIERAYSNYTFDECSEIYSPGKVLSNGSDPDGLGPAFGMCQGSTTTQAKKGVAPDAMGRSKQ